ncbi:MAG: hypothetical protein RBR16_13860 [Syntrophus sp. (in: bacteria)]|nr:hypothetical protein [Syntrophus sp. (in: bacteria)]
MRKIIALVLAGLIFTGCGIAAKVRARNDLEASKAAYKRCLEAHPDDPSTCEALKQAYKADLKAYSATSGDIHSDHTVSIEAD